ncbi:MAG: hypothetical protein ACR2K5_02940 [Pseudolabrys sp.]
MFPQLKTEAEFAWISGKSFTYAMLGFGGNGITFGMIAAGIFRAALRGSPDPDAELFALR